MTDPDMTERMAAIRARLEAGGPTMDRARSAALDVARADLAYLLDGLAARAARHTAAQGREAASSDVVEAAREWHHANLEAIAEHVIDPNNDAAERRAWRRCMAANERLENAVRALSAAPSPVSPLLALGRAALALERACRAWEAALGDAVLSLAEGRTLREAREQTSREYAAALKAAMEGETT